MSCTITIVCPGVKAECTDEAAKSHKVHTHLKSFTACNSTRVFQEYIVHPAVFAMKLHLQVLCFVCMSTSIYNGSVHTYIQYVEFKV